MKTRKLETYVRLICLPFTVAAVLSLVCQAMGQPVNDNFANASSISGTNRTVSGSLAGCTSEPGESLIPFVSTGQTAWWKWTAPRRGVVTVSVGASNFDPLVTVYTGDTLEALSLVASNNYVACYSDEVCGCHWRVRPTLSFHVTKGQTYAISVDSELRTDASLTSQRVPVFTYYTADGPLVLYQDAWGPTFTTNVVPGGAYQFNLNFTQAPVNDDFEKRLKLSGTRTQVRASNPGASKQPGEPEHSGNPGGSSVWFSWTAPASGRATITTNDIPPYLPPSWTGGGFGLVDYLPVRMDPTCGQLVDQNPPPSFFPIFAAYTGSAVDSLTPANCLPMGLDAYPYGIEFDAVKGQTYQIAFDGNMGTTGDVTLCLAFTKPAVNDNFKKRIPIHGIYVTATGFNAGSTHEPGEPVIDGSTGKSAWWTWIAPVNGSVSIDLSGSDYPFPIAIYTGSTVSNLSAVASGTNAVTFEATQGQAYQIAVGDSSGLTGQIKFTVRAPVVEVPLVRARTSGGTTLLSYTATPGEKILLQRSQDGATWQDVTSTIARRNTVSFASSPKPTVNGPFYRAVIVDYLPR